MSASRIHRHIYSITLIPTISDDHYYELHLERSRALTEKDTLEKAYQNLIQEHQILQASLEEAAIEKEDALTRLRDAQREAEDRRNDKVDYAMRAEIDRLRAEL